MNVLKITLLKQIGVVRYCMDVLEMGKLSQQVLPSPRM